MKQPIHAEIQSGLRRIRRARLLSHVPFYVAIGVVIAGYGLDWVSPGLGSALWNAPLLQAVLAACAGGTLLAYTLGYAIAELRCPRCREPFHHRRPVTNNPFTRRCLHCGLRLDGTDA